MNKCKQITLTDRIRAAVKSFKDGRPHRSIQLGLKVVRCDECEQGNCETCAYKREFEALMALPNCNNCGDIRDCAYAPPIGEHIRNNCPLWRPKKEKEANR